MNDGVESGKTSTEYYAAIASFATPILNGLLTKYLGIAPISDQVLMVMIGALVAYIGARTLRKNAAAKAGLHDSAALQTALTEASAITDPAARAEAIKTVMAKLPSGA